MKGLVYYTAQGYIVGKMYSTSIQFRGTWRARCISASSHFRGTYKAVKDVFLLPYYHFRGTQQPRCIFTSTVFSSGVYYSTRRVRCISTSIQ